ncbi:unnamed protein product [Rotaria sp. Silwood1]|nr:unnamed protein product [Rotaria sp. Silwood1]
MDPMKQIDENNRRWQVDLTLTSDNDPDLNALTERMREETYPEKEGWDHLGLIIDNENIVKVSDFGMARQMSSSSSSSMFYQEKYDKPFPLRWSSPEVLINRKYSSKSDV